MAIIDKIKKREANIRYAYGVTRELYQKLDAVDRSGNRTTNAYFLIRRLLSKIEDLVDDAFNVPLKRRIQRDVKKSLSDINRISDYCED